MSKLSYLPKLKPKLPQSPIFKERFYKHKLINGQSIPETSPISSHNPFLALLASPLRQDRSRRSLVIPRELLIKYQIIRNDNDNQLWMAPDVKDVLPSSNVGATYLVNRDPVKMKYERVANLNLYKDNNGVYNSVRDIKWNEQNGRIIDELYVERLRDEFKNVRIKSEKEEENLPEIYINLRKKHFNSNIFDYSKEHPGRIMFDLYSIKNKVPQCYEMFKGFTYGEDPLVLRCSEANKKFITTFLRFYLFHYIRRN